MSFYNIEQSTKNRKQETKYVHNIQETIYI